MFDIDFEIKYKNNYLNQTNKVKVYEDDLTDIYNLEFIVYLKILNKLKNGLAKVA